MFYTAPSPPLPVPIYSVDDCQKGSRDCFPEDTQGGVVSEISANPLEDLSLISELVATSGQPISLARPAIQLLR